MNWMKTCALALLTFITISCSTKPVHESRIEQASYSDVQNLTLKVGDTAPSFSLPNGDGELLSLASLLKEQHVMLIFYRGQWCPFCISQLESFEAVLPQLTKHNVKLVAISPEIVKTSQNTQRNFGLDYLFLSDVNFDAIKRYGVKAEADANLPHPAIFLINQQGKLVWFHASENYQERPSGPQMLKVVNQRLK